MNADVDVDSPSAAMAVSIARERLSSGLRSLLLAGSCLSSETRCSGSIPDLFALVDDTSTALARLDTGAIGRCVSPFLPPTTIALRASTRGPTIAKLNLIEPPVLSSAIHDLPDLYLAGRLSKRAVLVSARSSACEHELCELIDAASRAVAAAALLGLPRCCPIQTVVRRCFELSYTAEVRPETEAKLRVRFDVFASFYSDRFRPLIAARVNELGLDVRSDILLDARPDAIRRTEAATLDSLLLRSRLRSMARWPKQALVYQGWASYLANKIRRSREV